MAVLNSPLLRTGRLLLMFYVYKECVWDRRLGTYGISSRLHL